MLKTDKEKKTTQSSTLSKWANILKSWPCPFCTPILAICPATFAVQLSLLFLHIFCLFILYTPQSFQNLFQTTLPLFPLPNRAISRTWHHHLSRNSNSIQRSAAEQKACAARGEGTTTLPSAAWI